MRKLLLASLLISTAALAAGEQKLEPVPEPPPLPAHVESGQAIEPEVTIRKEHNEQVTEYRVNGRLYMVKVQPSVGPAYYLVDTNGDGRFDSRREGLETDMKIPGWVLLSW